MDIFQFDQSRINGFDFESDAVNVLAYNSKTNEMAVAYASGDTIYVYPNIQESTFNLITGNRSVGSALSSALRSLGIKSSRTVNTFAHVDDFAASEFAEVKDDVVDALDNFEFSGEPLATVDGTLRLFDVQYYADGAYGVFKVSTVDAFDAVSVFQSANPALANARVHGVVLSD